MAPVSQFQQQEQQADLSEEPSEVSSSDAEFASSAKAGAHLVSGNEKPRERQPRFGHVAYMTGLAACAALNSTNVGFDIGVSSGVAVILREKWDLTPLQVGLFLGSIQFVAAVGALFSQRISDKLGRRRTFTIAQLVLVVGLIFSACAGSFELLMVGRVFLGMGVGLSMAIDPLYIAEVAPSDRRGFFTSWPEIAINLGILLGFCVNLFFTLGSDNPESWRFMVLTGLIMPVLLIILSLTVMPESPRWLVAKGRVQEAQYILRRTHPASADVAAVVEGIRNEIAADEQADKVGWSAVLCPTRDVAKMLLVGVGVAVAQQLNGSESVVAYSPEIFKQAGVASTSEELFAATILVGVVKAAFVLFGALSADSWGRRPLLVFSTSFMTISLALLSVALVANIGWLAVVAVCSFMATFSVGVGPMTWLMAAEAFTSQYRAKGMSLATFANRFTSGVVALTFLPLSSLLGGEAQYFAFYAVLTCTTAIWMLLVAPETKGKTLEELHSHKADSNGSKVDAEKAV